MRGTWFLNQHKNQNRDHMDTKQAAIIFKAWAQDNHLLGQEFPVPLEAAEEKRDELFDSLMITAASESILRRRHLIAIGFNEVARKVFAFTSRKVSQREVKTLPKEIDGDIAVEYVHAGVAYAGVPFSGVAHRPYTTVANGAYTCGSSIHPARHIGAGTMGCLVRTLDGGLFGLTNNHISGLCNYSLDGEKILAPGHLDITANGLNPFTIGYHARSLPMVAGVPDNVDVGKNQDAALFTIIDANAVSSMQGQTYDTPAAVTPIQAAQQVEKVGRTTGHTTGTVIAQLAGPFYVNYNVPGVCTQIVYFEPVFIVQGVGGAFSQPGDSGSLVTVNHGGQRSAVGIVYAGDSQGLSYILPLQPILTTLEVSLVSGHNT